MTTTFAPVVTYTQDGLYQALVLIDRNEPDSELEVLEIGSPVEVQADAYRTAIIEASRRHAVDVDSSSDATRVETSDLVSNPQPPMLTLLHDRSVSQQSRSRGTDDRTRALPARARKRHADERRQ